MADTQVNTHIPVRRFRHRGRASQVLIYLGKQLRFFIYGNDWKVLPMAAVIAALVSIVIRKDFFLTMEGDMKGAFALTCVALWNGCFNSIQSVVRERPIVKREHRSGMHISSYVAAIMIYQLLLCAAQTALTMYVMRLLDVPFPKQGFMTRSMSLDIAISMLLISYASNMISLFLSSISHTTTSAMTMLPFVLIFQLVFSGGILPLPDWTRPISNYTISNYGVQVIAAQTGYNEAPMASVWKTVNGMRDEKITADITAEQLFGLLESPSAQAHRDEMVSENIAVGDLTDMLLELKNSMDPGILKKVYTVDTTVGEIIDLIGEEKVKDTLEKKTAVTAQKPVYDRTVENITNKWLILGCFALVFALLSVLVLERIDHDKR